VDVHRLVDGFLIFALGLTACSDDGGSASTSSTDGSSADTSSSGTETGSSGMDSTTSETDETTGTDECGGQTPALFCDTMLAFYEDATSLIQFSQIGCQLLSIFGRGVGPDGILLDGVFATEPLWIVTYVCPGSRIEHLYSASAAEYPVVTEYVEAIDPSDFKKIEAAFVDSPAMMEVYAGTNCPDILTLDQPRFVFQPSAINQSDAVYEIGETSGDRASILVDAQGAILEILPCP
jgi:hypothetical protein